LLPGVSDHTLQKGEVQISNSIYSLVVQSSGLTMARSCAFLRISMLPSDNSWSPARSAATAS
jgi:hypothetical protein